MSEIEILIDAIVKDNDIVLFMKGEKTRPMCGFSAQVVGILNQYEADFFGVNILESDEMRDAVKEYSQWPTYPQLYIKGKLIGGGDIIAELHDEGEFEALLS